MPYAGRRIRPKSNEFWQQYTSQNNMPTHTVSSPCTVSPGTLTASYEKEVKAGTFDGCFDDYAEFCKYREELFRRIDSGRTGSVTSQFVVEPAVKAGWAVRPFVPPSPKASRLAFSVRAPLKSEGREKNSAFSVHAYLKKEPEPPVIKKEAENKPPVKLAHLTSGCAVDLTLTDSEDESGPNQLAGKPAVPLMDRLVSKIRLALGQIPATPLYDRLKKKRESEAPAWIGREERGRLREKGYFVPESDALPVLSPDSLQTVQDLWSARDDGETVAEAGDIPLTLSDLRRFKGKTWLNDECINGYLQLVQARNPTEIHSFNTFFYATLCKIGYSGVQRWSRRFDLFSKRLVLIPVHLGMHWTMSCIDLENRRIMYMDSFHAGNNTCLDALWSYLESEHLDKKGRPWDSTGWTAQSLSQGVPRQLNGFDCGVFTCVFGEHLARRVPFDFTQNDMPYFRLRLTYELATGELLS